MKFAFPVRVFLLSAVGLVYQSVQSSSSGRFNGGTSCGSCHGSATIATTVSINGLPTTYVAGQSYPLTFTVSHATNPKAGFNISVSGGTLTAGAGTKVSGSQITQSTPMALTAGTATFSFTWKAPATPVAITFNGVGNAVNGNGTDDSGDKWNNTSKTITGTFATGVSGVSAPVHPCYPNPTSASIAIDGLGNEVNSLLLYTLQGDIIRPEFTLVNQHIVVDCSRLPKGIYLLSAETPTQQYQTKFVKE